LTEKSLSFFVIAILSFLRREEEAISPLHIPFGIKCFEGIASPDRHQARNDAIELFACNDEGGHRFAVMQSVH